MRGVIAAGSIPTAEAGAEVLAAGGNAVDAAMAAIMAVNAGEPTLTSLAAGGVMMHRDGATGAVTVVDCFADAPHLGADDVEGYDFRGIELDYGPVKQTFHIGAGSAAVPGILPGVFAASKRWGTLSLSDIVAPACRMLRAGARIGRGQAKLARLLEPILTLRPEARAIFAPDGEYLREGSIFKSPRLAETLEAMAAGGGAAWYAGELVPQMVRDFGPGAGGLFSDRDFEQYTVGFHTPLRIEWGGHTVNLMPPPAAGGTMIGLMLDLLDGALPDVRTRAGVRRLATAMAVADEARKDGAMALHDHRLPGWRARFQTLLADEHLPARRIPGGPPSTTHISVLDADGNACAVTFSHGESNGLLIGDTGIVMNNLLGEEDLHPDGFGVAPRGERLATMMSPTLVTSPDGDVVALGTGGANRIRTAILQALLRICGFDDPVEAAIRAPRMHFEGGRLSLETFDRAAPADTLLDLGVELARFPEPDLFFGGVHVARRRGDGRLSGAGDARRGGVCRVV